MSSYTQNGEEASVVGWNEQGDGGRRQHQEAMTV